MKCILGAFHDYALSQAKASAVSPLCPGEHANIVSETLKLGQPALSC